MKIDGVTTQLKRYLLIYGFLKTVLLGNLTRGNHLTMVSSGYSSTMTLELVKLLKKFNINIDFNLCIVKPLNTDEILNSVKKTGKIIIIDSGHKILGRIEIMSRILEKNIKLKNKPLRIGLPDNPTPSSRAFVKNIYK